jgi:DNA-directed RNA polymerase subunit RPC12/RpoP
MEDFINKQIVEEVLDVDCPSCGSKLSYAAEKQKILCQHCGYQEDYKRSNDKIIEIPLKNSLEELQTYSPRSEDKKVYDCKSCSAKFTLDADKTRIICAFCGSENINLEAFDQRYIQPAGIIPFHISRKAAEEAFSTWIKKGWFHPNKLKELAKIYGLHGVYIPFWTYDAKANAQWKGEAGTYYYETVRVKVGDQWQTKQVQKVRWQWRSGSFQHFFDDIVVSASANLKQDFLERILPYRLEETVNFDPRLMVGWESEIYNVELDKGYETAEVIMDRHLYNMASHSLGGDTQRNLSVQSQKFDQTFKHLIMPVWLASYTYNDKIYRFVINGQTGKVHGKKPYSWIKITFAVLLLILIILAVIALTESDVFVR